MWSESLQAVAEELEQLEVTVVDTRKGLARLATVPGFCCSTSCSSSKGKK